jgi:hypothetical protein
VRIVLPLFSVAILFFWLPRVWAARVAVIDSDEAVLLETPNRAGKILEKLKQGDEVAASNLPVEGFFKVRTQSGILGWMSEEVLELRPPPISPPTEGGEEPPAKDPLKKKVIQQEVHQRVRFRGFGGYNYFNLNGIVTSVSISQLAYFGGEFTYLISPGFGIILRGERITQNINLTDAATSNLYQIGMGSTPITVGPEFGIVGNKLAVHFSMLGGIGFNSLLQATGTTDSTSGMVSASLPFTAIVKADLTWQFSRVLGLFAEGGFRYLHATDIGPTGNSPILQPLSALDFRGPFLGAGLSAGF